MPQPGYVIDSAAFAREGRHIDGEIEVRTLPRLADSLAGDQGRLRFSARGETGPEGKLYLDLETDGTLSLRCQRCLAQLEFPVVLRSRFLLVPPGAAWPEDELTDDRFDAIAAEHEQDLVALIEQEVMLAIPLAPRHDQCALPGPADDKEKVSAFAALAALKRDAH